MKIAKRHPEWAEMLSSDLENENMNLQAATKMLYEAARKKSCNRGYCMEDEEAEKLLIDFYKLPETASTPEAEGFVDLLGLL